MKKYITTHDVFEGAIDTAPCPKCGTVADESQWLVHSDSFLQTTVDSWWKCADCGHSWQTFQFMRPCWMVHPNGDVTQIFPNDGMIDDYVDLLAVGFVPATWADVRKAYADDIRAEVVARTAWAQRQGVRV